MANVFDAQVKAVDAFSGPMSRMMKGMRDIIAASKGVTKTSAEGSKSAANAAKESAEVVEETAHKASKSAAKAAKDIKESAHAAEEATHKAEAAHLRYFRSMGAHVRLLHGHFGELNASIGEVGKSLKEFLPALGALGAGASLVGMFEMTKETAEAAIAMDAAAQQAGVTAKEYAGLAWAAKESGKSAEIMDRGMKRLNVTMGDVTLGKNKDAAAVFAHMGIKLQDSAHHARSTVDVLKDLADGFSKTKDATLRASAAQIIMSRAGVEMLPILMRGRNGLADLIKAGEDYADIGDDAPRDKLKEFGHTWGEMDAAAEGFKTRLSTELAPALQPIVELARDWIMANRDWIATAMASRVQALGDAVKGILGAIDDVHKGTKTWGQVIREGAANHIELTAAVGGLMLVLGSPLLTAIRSAGLAFLSLGRFVRGVTLLMRASPMITLALALAAVAAVIIEQWDPTLPFFTNILNGIKSVFVSVWSYIEPIVDSLKGAFNWLSHTNFGKTLGLDHLPATVAAGVQYVGNVLTGPAGNPEYAGVPGGLYRPGGPALSAAQQKGEVRVKVDFANAPPGTQVRSDVSGIAQPPDTSVGYSNPLVVGGF